MIQRIKQEIDDNAYAAMTPEQIADKLNTADIVVQGEIPIQQLLLWTATTGAMARLRSLVATNEQPLAGIAEAALQLIGLGLPLDPSNTEVGFLLTSLTGTFTEDEIASLLARGQRTISRAEQLGLGFVFAQNVIDAQHA